MRGDDRDGSDLDLLVDAAPGTRMTAQERAFRLTDLLDHMIEASSLAQGYVAGLGKPDFLTDRRTQQAVVLNLITIGEVAARVLGEHADLRAARTKLPAS